MGDQGKGDKKGKGGSKGKK